MESLHVCRVESSGPINTCILRCSKRKFSVFWSLTPSTCQQPSLLSMMDAESFLSVGCSYRRAGWDRWLSCSTPLPRPPWRIPFKTYSLHDWIFDMNIRLWDLRCFSFWIFVQIAIQSRTADTESSCCLTFRNIAPVNLINGSVEVFSWELTARTRSLSLMRHRLQSNAEN